jgi:hypothetical protein
MATTWKQPSKAKVSPSKGYGLPFGDAVQKPRENGAFAFLIVNTLYKVPFCGPFSLCKTAFLEYRALRGVPTLVRDLLE